MASRISASAGRISTTGNRVRTCTQVPKDACIVRLSMLLARPGWIIILLSLLAPTKSYHSLSSVSWPRKHIGVRTADHSTRSIVSFPVSLFPAIAPRRITKMSQQAHHDPPTETPSPPVSKKRPRPATEPEEATRPASATLGLKEMSLEAPSIPNPRKLRLEAIFHPKFENEKSNQEIRNEMKQRVESKQGYLEVTLKHSGSLILWSGGQRYYSKNSTSNQFTMVAEILLRQHFERAWRKTGEGNSEYKKCSQFLEESRLTCAFEVVTSVLGDHGDIPHRDFLILTAVADRTMERFYSTSQVLEFAQRFRLPHNDAWAFTTAPSVQTLFDLYDSSRETGLATDTIAALSGAAQAHVASMYPHSEFQGEILEGFIIRYIHYPPQQVANPATVEEQLQTLATRAQEILKQVPPSSPASFELENSGSVLYEANIRNIFQEQGGWQRGMEAADAFAETLEGILSANDGGKRRRVHRTAGTDGLDLSALTNQLTLENCDEDHETKRIAELLQTLSNLNKTVKYFMFQEQLPEQPPRTLCVINVLHDQSFLKFQQVKEPTAMNLFRGFVVELDTDEESPMNNIVTPMDSAVAETSGPFLMLKMKLLPYMVRTFICRNQLNILEQDGPDAFVRASVKLLQRWSISPEGQEHWIPFIKQWAIYAKTRLNQSPDDDLPPLNSFSYLKHLEHFSQLYEKGEIVPSEEEAANKFCGTVCVVATSNTNAEHAAKAMAKALECSKVLPLKEAASRWTIQGVICFGEVGSFSKKVREFLDQTSDHLAIVMYGCSPEEIGVELLGEPPGKIKAEQGKCKTWCKQRCSLKLDLAKASISDIDSASSDEFQQAVQKIKEVTDLAPGADGASDSRPGVLVYVPGIPGCGKSSLLQSMEKELSKLLVESCQDGADRKVHVLVGDEYGKSFWQKVKSDRQKDVSSVTIVDKNIPPPSWSAVGTACSSSSAFPLAVFPDDAAFRTTRILGSRKPDGTFDPLKSHFYPFSLEYLAICMARVLQREPSSHVGKLDSGTPNAAMVVVMFYSLYRYKSAEEFQDNIDMRLKTSGTMESLKPVQIPFIAHDKAVDLPTEVKDALTEALQLQLGYDHGKTKMKTSDPVVMEMEQKLRDCIASFQDELLSKAAVLGESKKSFKEQIVERILSLNLAENSEVDVDTVAEPRIKLVSIDVPKTAVHRIIEDQVSRDDILPFTLSGETRDSCWETDHYKGELFVENTHVTMLFWQSTTQAAIRQNFLHLLGSTVQLHARALLWDENVAALEVSVSDVTTDGKKVPAPENEFSHVTVWVAEGAEAWMSNSLRNNFKEDKARRIEFTAPVLLSGSFSFWDFENTPLPIE